MYNKEIKMKIIGKYSQICQTKLNVWETCRRNVCGREISHKKQLGINNIGIGNIKQLEPSAFHFLLIRQVATTFTLSRRSHFMSPGISSSFRDAIKMSAVPFNNQYRVGFIANICRHGTLGSAKQLELY